MVDPTKHIFGRPHPMPFLFCFFRGRRGWKVTGTWLRTKIKGCGFNPRPPLPAIFQPRIAKKINKALSVRVIVICSDHKFLWRHSYKGVDRTSTSPGSILHKIIIMIIYKECDEYSVFTQLSCSNGSFKSKGVSPFSHLFDVKIPMDIQVSFSHRLIWNVSMYWRHFSWGKIVCPR